MDGKQDQSFCYIQEAHLNIKDRYHFRVKGWNKIFQACKPKKQASKSIQIPNKTDFKTGSSKDIEYISYASKEKPTKMIFF